MNKFKDAWKIVAYPSRHNYIEDYELEIDSNDYPFKIQREDFKVLNHSEKLYVN